MSRIAVIGSGISGLSAAYFLGRQGHQVTILEASPRAGGAIRTERTPEGAVMEMGPDSFLLSKPAAMNLAREVGVELVPSCAQGSPSVVKGGRLMPLPDGFRLLAPTRFLPFALSGLVSWTGKLRAAAELVVPPKSGCEDESVADFVTRRFGREILDALAQPLVAGIYSADPGELSLQATFPFLQTIEQKQGSVIKGMVKTVQSNRGGGPLFWSPREGMGHLVERLTQRVGHSNLRLSCPVSSLRRVEDRWLVYSARGEELFDAVVLGCPAYRAGSLLEQELPQLSKVLHTIPYTTTAVVHLLLEENQLGVPLRGSGFVVPHREELDITACTYAHRKYPGRVPAGKALLRVNMGGELNQGILAQSNEQLASRALEALRPLLKLSGTPEYYQVVRHHKVVPQYAVGHLKVAKQVEGLVHSQPGLALAGNGVNGVGLGDCVVQAEECARRIQAHLSQAV